MIVYDRGIRNPFITGRGNIKTQGLFYEQVSSVYDQPLSVDLPAKSVV